MDNPLQLRESLTESEWLEMGEKLSLVERGHSWWIGDWWVFGESRYGARRALTDSPDWKGPKFQTCMNAASVCRAFETSRRREVLSFKHHALVAPLSTREAEDLLDLSVAANLSSVDLKAEISRRRVVAGMPAVTDAVSSMDGLVSSGRRFGCIYADPPWLYGNQGTRAATRNHYKGMTVDELCTLPVAALAAPDSHLHLWTTNGFIFECPRIFDSWGFTFKSSFIWVKQQMGIGNYWRNSHEFLLTAVRGNAKRFNDHSLKSWVETKRRAHSEKPEQARGYIERASPGPFLELFGRSKKDGWVVWGDQIDGV